MLKLSWEKNKVFDIGQADEYIGPPFSIPYFFEASGRLMMKEPDSPDVINFKTWKGEYFQFYLGKFHSATALVITSTLKDCCFIKANNLSIKGMHDWAEQHFSRKYPIKGSFSGYYTFGKRLMRQYDILEKHLKEQNLYFPDDILVEIYNELVRREKDGNR